MIDLLTPIDVGHKKVRLGPPSDGGYVMPEIVLEKCSALFTYGVEADIRYEINFVKSYNKPAHMFDHTINQPTGMIGENLFFYDEGLGFANKCKDVIDHYDMIRPAGTILLKIDIEGNEYDYFDKVDIDRLANITDGILIEIHWLTNSEYRVGCSRLIEKLRSHFTLCHVHGNNHSGVFEQDEYMIPSVLELSFINKKLVEIEKAETRKYPIKGLDFANVPTLPDYELSYINR